MKSTTENIGGDRLGYGPLRIDTMCNPAITQGFIAAGLGDMLPQLSSVR
jgi:hypothetical protein